MKHYILTRSAYGPEVAAVVNRQRLSLLAGVTAASLRSQTNRDLTWLVLIDPRDPLLKARIAAIESAGLPYIAAPAEKLERRGVHDRPYGPWAKHIDWCGPTLTTRLDDDDALAPFAMASVRAAAEAGDGSRVMWTLPTGFRIVGRRYFKLHWPLAQFVSLHAPADDHAHVCEVNHMGFARMAPLQSASEVPAWLWVRHRATRSRITVGRQAASAGRTETYGGRTPAEVKAAFKVDWALIERQM